jgi:hypothetical protein
VIVFDFVKHRAYHRALPCKSLDEQFMLQIGNACEECNISKNEDNNTSNISNYFRTYGLKDNMDNILVLVLSRFTGMLTLLS